MEKKRNKVNSKKVFAAILKLAYRRGTITKEELQKYLASERLRDNPKIVRKIREIREVEPD